MSVQPWIGCPPLVCEASRDRWIRSTGTRSSCRFACRGVPGTMFCDEFLIRSTPSYISKTSSPWHGGHLAPFWYTEVWITQDAEIHPRYHSSTSSWKGRRGLETFGDEELALQSWAEIQVGVRQFSKTVKGEDYFNLGSSTVKPITMFRGTEPDVWISANWDQN